MLPMVMSDLFFREAVMVTISSGIDVPIATIDNAIKNDGIPRVFAMEIVDSISSQAPNITLMIPIIINRMFFCIFFIPLVSIFCFCCFALRIYTYIAPMNIKRNITPPI